MENSFLEEGSPTMVEKGMDPASVFEMCDDDDDNGIHDVKDSGGGGAEGLSAAAAAVGGSAALPSASDGAASLRHRRRGQSVERTEPKTKRESWMDPPEETESITLTQAEMESCMQTYAVRTHSCQTEPHFRPYEIMNLFKGPVVAESIAKIY